MLPSFVDRLPVTELAAVWILEVSHLLRDHHGRADRLPDLHRMTTTRSTSHRTWKSTTICSPTACHCPPTASTRNDPGCRPACSSRRTYRCCPRPRRHATAAPGRTAMPGHGTGHRVPAPAQSARSRPTRSDGPPPAPSGPQPAARETCPAGGNAGRTAYSSRSSTGGARLTGAVREAVAWASGAVDYTYQRPSRRQAALGLVVLPRLRQPVPRVPSSSTPPAPWATTN